MIPAVRRLSLTDFRGYSRLDLSLEGRFIVLTGANGAGKTNLLEALSFLAPGRGLRRAALPEVQRLGSDNKGWAVAASLDTASGPVDLGTGVRNSDRRLVRLNGEPLKSQSELSQILGIAWLTPAMDRLFQDGSSGRRRFLDRMVQGFDPGHAARLTAYDHAMRERLRLLKERRADPAWLGGLERAMADHGLAAAHARHQMTIRLQQAVEAGIGPFPAADLSLDRESEQMLTTLPPDEAAEYLRQTFARRRRIDADAGATTFGPHRIDLLVRHRSKQMPATACSTGEQKALLIALILANARLLREASGMPPLLLLDEVAAHLDEPRRAALYDELTALGGQVWLTGTDRALFAALGPRGQHFTVSDASLSPVG
jgi:DNA replication and repair protein RecF